MEQQELKPASSSDFNSRSCVIFFGSHRHVQIVVVFCSVNGRTIQSLFGAPM